jgi:hypothetical protein
MQRYCLTRMESVERVSQDVDVLVSSLQETNFVKKGSSIQLDLICKISNQQPAATVTSYSFFLFSCLNTIILIRKKTNNRTDQYQGKHI